MKRVIAMVLLLVGISLAAAFGSRNGDTLVRYRALNGAAQLAVSDDDKAAAARARDAMVLPPPRQRLAEWLRVGGLGWGLGVGLIVAGAVLARREQAQRNAGTGSAESGRVDFPGTVAEMQRRVEKLSADIAELPMDDEATPVRNALDDIASDLIAPVVEGRGQLLARHGMAGFATYFGPFSSAERQLARCWSALTDGHAVVARSALVAALGSLEQTVRAWEAAEAP